MKTYTEIVTRMMIGLAEVFLGPCGVRAEVSLAVGDMRLKGEKTRCFRDAQVFKSIPRRCVAPSGFLLRETLLRRCPIPSLFPMTWLGTRCACGR